MVFYHIADWFFVFFHSLVVLLNLFGWTWKSTRIPALILQILTGLSWSVLGIWYGLGYCPLTDWHWQVLHQLGQKNIPNSYMKYLFDRITGLSFDPNLVDNFTLISFLLAFSITLALTIRDLKALGKKKAIQN